MRSVVGTSRVGVFTRASAGRFLEEILGFWRELSGEMSYYRYVDIRYRRRFPAGSVMTRREYERWRAEAREHGLWLRG
ncbi:MAG: CstA-like transporter-associated (seleno)protein [Rubrobacter sp.]